MHRNRKPAIGRLLGGMTFILLLVALFGSAAAQPTAVTLVGDVQSELGCPGDWQPECANTQMSDAGNGVWRAEFSIPAGNWQYKMALNETWDVSYPADNRNLTVGAETAVRFYFDDKSTAVMDSVNNVVATAAGNFQSELGCPGDWQPECVRTLLTDVDGDGIYTFSSSDIPAGDYEFKVALDEGWDTSFPADNVMLSVAAGDTVTISYNSATDEVSSETGAVEPGPTAVTLVGDVQSELGCPGDWQPECATSQLSKIGNGVWRAEFSIPAGNWQYKMALNETWDVSYPADNKSLSVGAETAVRFYFDDKSTAVMDSVNNVVATAAGNFQSELGCPGDWQPECVRTLLTDVDGDGVYTFSSSDIPAGDYEFKVALDEGWDTAFPADNVPLSVAEGDTVTISYNSATNEVTADVSGGGGLEPGDPDLVRNSLRTPLADELFYFVLPDRFEDGDSSNNTGGLPGGPLDHGYLPTDKGYYHGGDIAGLQARLDYLQSLGVTAIWMTPQFTNRPVQGDGTIEGSSAAYHGYWQVDYTTIDPHFGSNAEMLALIADAQGRGMKVFFDIVLNHTADVITYEEGIFTYRNKTDFPYRDADGVIFDDRDYAGGDTFPELDPAISFPYTPAFPTTADETAKNPAWLNNRIYYHNRGDSTFSGESSQYGDFFGLDDLFTEHPDVVNGMIDIHKNMISTFDIDGFRVDTVKHVNDELWEAFVPEILAHAAAEGNDDFFIFGEVFSGDAAYTSRYTTELDFPSLLDFGFDGAASNFAARGAATNQLADFFASDDYYIDDDSNAYGLVKFIGNHDIGRLGYVIDSSNPGAADAERVARWELAQALNAFSRGIPLLYYGDEQGFTGDGGDKDARQNMFPSQVASYNDDDLIGTTATTADSNFDSTHTLYESFSDMALLRDAHVALRQGAQIQRYAGDAAGLFAFSRIDPTERVEYLVVFNNSESAAAADIPVGTPDSTWTELYDSDNGATIIGGADTVNVSLPPLSSAIYRADNSLPAATAAPDISISAPLAGAEVLGRAEIAAAVGSDAYAEVTFAVSADGGEYMVIGTDDNAPYRVFYDVSGYPAGTELTFKAIVNLDGQLNAATVTVTVGEETPPPAPGDAPYAVIHYFRDDGDYGDHTTGDYNDYWGLHLWGDIEETIEWTAPKPFLGEDDYGRFAWVKLAPAASEVGFIIHRGDAKDGTDADRFFDPGQTPQIWLRQDDATIYTSQAAAQGYVTIRYHRDDGDYGTPSEDYTTFWGLHLWGDAIADGVGTEWTSPRPFDGIDEFGAFWNVPIKATDLPVNFIIHRGDEKDPGPDQSLIPAENAAVWINSGDETIYPSLGAAENRAILHYHRNAGDYGDYTSSDFNDFWGMHVWTGAAAPNPGWTEPLKPVAVNLFGPEFSIPLTEDATELAYILHRGDEKDPGPDQFLVLDKWGFEVWQLEGEGPNHPDDPHYVLPVLSGPAGANPGNINQHSAYWVEEDIILWDAAGDPNLTYALVFTDTGGLEATDMGIINGESITMTPGAASSDTLAKFPHLAALPGLQIPAGELARVPDILKGQIAVSAVNAGGISVDATGLQIPGVLDDLYTYDGDLGVTWDGDVPTIRVWAPTAKNVTLLRYADADPGTSGTAVAMSLDPASGVWSATGESGWKNQYYLFDVEVYVHSTGQVENNLVTDPYSFSLAMNSTRSQIVDLSDPALRPEGWDSVSKPPLVAPEEISIYEIHMRDFSANDPSVPEELQGTYKAFTLPNSNGMRHLQALQEAGLSHLHLLPVFDIATIDEDKSSWQAPDPAVLATYPPDSEQQQAAVVATEELDAFNWGYDPFHYTAPEGSYSTDPNGSTRIVEFREMVQALNEDSGLRVVMDVVYNHTNAAGQAEKSVLDRIVPGYYHRLNDTGAVENSTCCANTASEHNMMEKLMVDSLVVWAREYKVDAFRFDLMGHHMKRNMLAVRDALDALQPETDGVDGSEIYLYGEGWNFGEVADNARGENATQLNMAGTGIGTFSDRLRDAVRGGSPFDGGEDLIRNQGFANGLYFDPNSLNSGAQSELDELLLSMDQIRVGMAGNLAAYSFVDRNGNVVTGAEVDYNGSPAGYTADPQENVSYVSKHDNQTLYDNNAYKIPLAATMAERVRAQNVALSTVILGQGVPFMHAGSDLLRSKSLDRDSYNSGDWFNRLDFSYQDSNWGVGLPVASKNQDNWPIMAPLLADPALDPAAADIQFSAALYQELLAIRESSPLFRLQTAAEVQERVAFHNTGPGQIPGLLVMSISDLTAVDLDPGFEFLVVLVNANDEPQSFTQADLSGMTLNLHPLQTLSVDPVVRTATFDSSTGTFMVPGRTTAVFTMQDMQEPCPDVPGNLLQNYCFEDGSGSWTFWTDGRGTYLTTDQNPYQGRFAADIAIQRAGSNVQFYQKDIHLKPDTAYELSFAAYSSNGRDLSVFLHQHTAPFTNYGLANFRVDLQSGWQVYQTTFTTAGFDSPVDDARLRFWMAPFDTDNMSYHLDWMVLREVDAGNPPIPPDPPVIVPPPGQCVDYPNNMIQNPGFENSTTGWSFYSDGRAAFNTAAVDPYECEHNAQVTIQKSGQNVQLFQHGLTLQGGERYQLRLAARSSGGQDVKLYLHQHRAPFTNYGINGVRLDLQPAWQVFVLEFTARGGGTLDDGRLRLWLAPFDESETVFEFDGVTLQPAAAVETAAPLDGALGLEESEKQRKQPPAIMVAEILQQGYFLDGDEAGRLRGGYVPGAGAAAGCAAAWPSRDTLQRAHGRLVPVRIVGPGLARVTITDITQNEPVGERADARARGALAWLRSERDENGEGRIYHVAFTAQYRGRACSHEVVVTVPIDRRTEVVDNGARFVSTEAGP